ncbi:Protein of unknown function DUF1644 [Macleaya cordata]|uniref:Uncharacterized protein n=1 Tax=Macleaya cordata TaxID=56857 RepID=A0A200PTR9_MACCD|nr:Protein of unknown function DUF1644 [Macleaya cordata]
MTDKKGSTSTNMDIHALHKEWDEALCPICMDHPHNAVLLVCSSHDNGCRSYICDTSYRHSNCLDRFKRLAIDLRDTSQPSSSFLENPDSSRLGESVVGGLGMRIDLEEAHEHYTADEQNNVTSGVIVEALGENNSRNPHVNSEMQSEVIAEIGNSSDQSLNLKCPLCRGTVKGWEIIKEAREYLDLKHRSCSGDSCSFIGNYRELRRHARRVHPTARPADINPVRQHAWRHLESQREYNDIISAIRSVTPSAIVFGDYVIDNVNAASGNRESGSGEGSGSRFADTFFLFQMISASRREPWGLSRALRRNRSSGANSGRRYLWGENLLGLQDEEDWNLSNDMGEDDVSPVPRRRRRFTQSRLDENP